MTDYIECSISINRRIGIKELNHVSSLKLSFRVAFAVSRHLVYFRGCIIPEIVVGVIQVKSKGCFLYYICRKLSIWRHEKFQNSEIVYFTLFT
ncbi:hypothetical protein D3C78_997120 [compost metagenome]